MESEDSICDRNESLDLRGGKTHGEVRQPHADLREEHEDEQTRDHDEQERPNLAGDLSHGDLGDGAGSEKGDADRRRRHADGKRDNAADTELNHVDAQILDDGVQDGQGQHDDGGGQFFLLC